MSRDIKEYMQRLLFASLLCPMAFMFWAGFAYAGFNLDSLIQLMGEASRAYAAMDADAQHHLRLEVYGVWAVLTFGMLFVSFVVRPPAFSYALQQRDGHWETAVVERR